MNLPTETSWTDSWTEMFASFAMASPVDDMQCLTWDACPDTSAQTAPQDVTGCGWHARLSGVRSET
jgi:hypothetical protein